MTCNDAPQFSAGTHPLSHNFTTATSTHQIPASPIWLLLKSRSWWFCWRARHRPEMYRMTTGKTETEGIPALKDEFEARNNLYLYKWSIMEFHQKETDAKLEVTCDAWIEESSAWRSAYISSRSWPMKCVSTRPSYVLSSAATRLATRRSGGREVVREWMASNDIFEAKPPVFVPMELYSKNVHPKLETTCEAWTSCVQICADYTVRSIRVSPASHEKYLLIPTKYQMSTLHVNFLKLSPLPKHRTFFMFNNNVEIMCSSKCPKVF